MRTSHEAEPMCEIDDLDLVDHHCHGVSAAPLGYEAFASFLTEGGRDMLGAIDPMATPLGLAVRSLCSPVLGIDPHAPIQEYMERRSALGELEVARRMVAAAGLSDLLIDTGYLADQVLTPAGMGRLGRYRTHEIVRIEAVAEEVFATAGGGAFVDEFPRALADRARGAVGLKSIVAYRAGLDLDAARPVARTVSISLARWSPGSRIADPVLLRHCLWVGVDVAEGLGIPIQLHSGFGDRDLDLWRADPTRFTPWLRRIPSSVKICFLHCWPYHRQAAFLAAVYPNVYLDTGALNTHAALGYERILAETLEVAPFEKVLYSSDALGAPELYYVGAMRFRSALASLLGDWRRRGFCAHADAVGIAMAIGQGNARKVYRLGE
ncbi:MAG: amidohydrolase family protein [bacterium]|nr:amidohydrolase family protein [bacterium]MDE0288844.1 amidohydrolase family protein [bacterium]MDE0438590.1 amidohydrolase family protein [bacterium]